MSEKVNITNWFRKDIFNKVIQYAKEHTNCDGVADAMDELYAAVENYKAERDEFIHENCGVVDELYGAYIKSKKTKKTVKIIFFVSLVMEIGLTTMNQYLSGRTFDLAFVCVLCGIAFAVLHFKVSNKKSAYMSLVNELEVGARTIITKYSSYAESLSKKIDDRYLASLDPVKRELELFKRHHEAVLQEQSRQHKAILQQYEATFKNMKESHDEETRVLKELLEIEKEREKRRGY